MKYKHAWVVADLHLDHRNICSWTERDGVTPARPWDTLEEMQEALITNWNERVGEGDRVYVLGDVVMHARNLPLIDQLKGKKVLVRGNHDLAKLSQYARHFEDVRGVVQKNGYVMTHVPIHPDCLERWGLNIHGHLHKNRIDDPRYICVSVEQTGYAPMRLDELLNQRLPRQS